MSWFSGRASKKTPTPVLDYAVKGGYGLRLQYFRKQDRPRRRRSIPYVGPVVFLIGVFLAAFIYAWNVPWLRRAVCIPALVGLVRRYDSLRLWLYDKPSITFPAELGYSNVTIVREAESGFVHIYADTLVSAVFGQGYAHARDRLWQMDIGRRRAMGALSELLGPVGLQTDRLSRTLNLHNLAAADWLALTEGLGIEKAGSGSGSGSGTGTSANDAARLEQASLLLAYSAGVNLFLSEECCCEEEVRNNAAQLEILLKLLTASVMGKEGRMVVISKSEPPRHEIWHPLKTSTTTPTSISSASSSAARPFASDATGPSPPRSLLRTREAVLICGTSRAGPPPQISRTRRPTCTCRGRFIR
jgi:Penicillin amidase